ncbi:MAG: dTDP-4-amino-4,6-dideoxygalactose transaminase, partial [Lachnospiraceae bacterium]|nr:dTDP-4-amino-4,6-dideoxygalactose transaminase [Lachnospiraceae bacterium]
KDGDEVIMPSYTFVSTANAFVLRGAKAVFVDIRPDTMNINEQLIEDAITEKTKAIVVVHYAGVACEMDYILKIAKKYNLPVVEDAAQGMMATYKGKALGTIGDLGCYSFHETKNYTMGEGGALVINNEKYIERAEILREKGTNRSRFYRGEIDKYSWVDIGSSYLPSEFNVAYLYGQLEIAEKINQNRLESWDYYYDQLYNLYLDKKIELPYVPQECKHNAHMFYIKVSDLNRRMDLLEYMNNHNVNCVFHYVPLHSAEGGIKYGRFNGKDQYTTRESDRLLRLPMYYDLSIKDKCEVVHYLKKYFDK